jgi:beta-xylosidase
MKSSFRFASRLFVLCIAWMWIANARAQTVPPPNSPQILHLHDFHIRDPWILADAASHTYYLYATNNGEVTGVHRAGVMVYKSKDLRNWERPSIVFTVPDGIWADPQETVWAPEVHAYHGKFYLFVTLNNSHKIIAAQPAVRRTNTTRGTTIAVSDSPEGPFTLLKTDGPMPPANFMTLDGTFYRDAAGNPWMVYAHEWAQKIDGTMEAVPLNSDLSGAAGPPIFLFKGSDAPWLDAFLQADQRELSYVTDGPELFRSKDGHLLMLWASFGPGGYIETIARSKSGELQGPWEQLPPLLEVDAGHGMLVHSFDGQLLLVLHRTNTDPYARIYEVEDDGDHLVVVRERLDLDGPDNEGRHGIP